MRLCFCMWTSQLEINKSFSSVVEEGKRASFSDHTQPGGKKLWCQHRLAVALVRPFYQTNPSHLNKSL